MFIVVKNDGNVKQVNVNLAPQILAKILSKLLQKLQVPGKCDNFTFVNLSLLRF